LETTWAQFGKQRVIFETKTQSPKEILTDDVDGDGDMDILFVAYSQIGWYENKGENDYNHLKIVDNGIFYSTAFRYADLDGDEIKDLITFTHDDYDNGIGTFSMARVVWYKGDGKGGFENSKTILQTEDNHFSAIDVADFNNDGLNDVVVGSRENDNVLYIRNEGNGNFANKQIIVELSGRPYDIRSSDLDKNGTMDIVIGSVSTIAWYSNDGSGHFTDANTLNAGFNGDMKLKIGDINGDGLEDVLAAGGLLVWFRNTGEGKFTVQKILSQNTSWHNCVAIADLDKDGDKDIVSASSFSAGSNHYFFWYENDGSDIGRFSEEKELSNKPISPNDIQIVDLDNDSDLDIVSSTGNGIVSWHENTGNVVFEEIAVITESALSLKAIFSTDLDGDGYVDVLSASLGDGRIAWYKNDGKGLFSEQKLIDIYAGYAISVVAGDLDGDNDKDIVTTDWAGDRVMWYENLGEGKFSESILISTKVDDSQAVFIADLDGDGDNDVLSASDRDDKVAWYRNDGKGNFDEQEIITHLNGASSIDVADLDKDGDLDVLSAANDGNKVVWCPNDGMGNFGEPIVITHEINRGMDAIAADLDGDGNLDVLSASLNDDKIAWYRNDGSGNFGEQNIISLEADNARAVVASDFDNDGDMDIVSASWGDNNVVWYKNNGGDFSERRTIASFPNVKGTVDLQVADIDGDDNMDIISGSFLDGKIAWYENISDFTKISGYTYYDANQNGEKDETELPLFNQNIVLQPEAANLFTDEEGRFDYFVKPNNYTLTYNQHPLWELTSSPETYSIEVTNNQELPLYNFGFTPARLLHQVRPHINSAPTRCNNVVSYWLNYVNTGTTTASGTVTFEFDELMEFVEAIPSPIGFQDGKWVWHFSDLQPSFTNQIELKFKMPSFDFVEELLETSAAVQVLSESGTILSNQNTDYTSRVLCSYDPNDKLTRSNLLGQSEFAYIEDTIYYTVRFQNTGNDVAFNIRIEDVLDKKLDWTTFHPITASHDYRTELNRETGLTTFFFDDIMLPDSTTNEVESHGFVTFGIASLAGIGDKTELENTASIFFDFNPAIVTNTVVNTLIEEVETDIHTLVANERKYKIRVFPNPFSDFATIEVEGLLEGNYRLELMDILGRKVRELKSMESGRWRIERGGLEGGVYLIRVLSSERKLVGSGKVLVE